MRKCFNALQRPLELVHLDRVVCALPGFLLCITGVSETLAQHMLCLSKQRIGLSFPFLSMGFVDKCILCCQPELSLFHWVLTHPYAPCQADDTQRRAVPQPMQQLVPSHGIGAGHIFAVLQVEHLQVPATAAEGQTPFCADASSTTNDALTTVLLCGNWSIKLPELCT